MVERRRRFFVVFVAALVIAGVTAVGNLHSSSNSAQVPAHTASSDANSAISKLGSLAIKGRAPMTGYSRAQFSADWGEINGCDLRNYILNRDLTNVADKSPTNCEVLSGTLDDPYTGKTIQFIRGAGTSAAVEIDHVVAIGDAWQKGAQQLSAQTRKQLYNDPLELLAADGPANVQKSDGDAATWLPPNKPYRCRYVARQIAVKIKYSLWVTQAEHDAMQNVLKSCPGQTLPAAQ